MKPLPNAAPKPKKTPPKAKKPLPKSTKPIVKRKRSASEFNRIYGSRERVEFVKALPDVVSGESPCDNVHIVTGGMGRKAGYQSIVAMTRAHHRELHNNGLRSFVQCYGVDLEKAAAETEQKWKAWQSYNQPSKEDAA